MQQLQVARKSKVARRTVGAASNGASVASSGATPGAAKAAGRAASSAADPAVVACSATILAGFPPVMWFVRKQVGRQKTKGLTVPQYRVLCVVSRAAGLSVSDVAANLGMELPMVSRAVQKLAGRGFLKIVPREDDRRRKSLALTRTGQAVVETSQARIRAALAERLTALSPAECRQINAALELLGGVFLPDAVE